MLTNLRARRRLAVALAPLFLLTACGDSDSGAGGGSGNGAVQREFEEQLEAMPGVDDARVDREAFDTDYWGEEIVVDMVPEVTAPELAAVLDALGERAQTDIDGIGEQSGHVTIGAGTTDSEGEEFDPGAPPLVLPSTRPARNRQLAEQAVAMVAAFPGVHALITESELTIVAESPDDDPRPTVEDLLDRILADRTLSAAEEIGLSVSSGDVYAGAGRGVQLSSWHGLDRDFLATWDDLSALMDSDAVRKIGFYETDLALLVGASGDPQPKQLTTSAYGDELWPAIRPAIEALAASDELLVMDVTNLYLTGGDYPLEDRFLRLDDRRDKAYQDRKGRTWNAEAFAYLDQVRATR